MPDVEWIKCGVSVSGPWTANSATSAEDMLKVAEMAARVGTKPDHFKTTWDRVPYLISRGFRVYDEAGNRVVLPKPEIYGAVRMKGGKRIDPRKARAKR